MTLQISWVLAQKEYIQVAPSNNPLVKIHIIYEKEFFRALDIVCAIFNLIQQIFIECPPRIVLCPVWKIKEIYSPWPSSQRVCNVLGNES